ncbi:hypothetical protein R2R35_22925 [Anaerocolumna sp. AGMB13020]|uniref:hypothetical protein n=1 Tax=Anaerocolumna sp. AGMB13020 TaxID=3081750 RepID=UPI0029548832|nr:hypothetical protein [Anaerocolumna sp. AGMB13020]WOO36611.1 hypothetical protein R2R35_22925 [Anaerocolumna sp. AGMB13020]
MRQFWGKGSLILLIALVIVSGCSRKEEKEMKLPIKTDFLSYSEGMPSAYTVDQNGLVYTARDTYKEKNEEFSVIIERYDLEGDITASFSLINSLGSSVEAMAAVDNSLYLTAQESSTEGSFSVLYSLDMLTGKLEKLCELPFLQEIKQLIYLEQRVYILSNRLIYLSLSDFKTYELGVELPVSIALKEDNSLMIQNSTNSGGYSLLSYNPKKDSLTTVAEYKTGKFVNFAVCGKGEQIIYAYDKNPRGLVLSPVNSLEEEAELYPEAAVYNSNFGIYYVKGQVYCITKKLTLVRFSLDAYLQGDRVLRYISAGYQSDEPFGCGYTMKRTELEDDKFALKVLAQDKDYDLCLMNSDSYFSYNIRENGIFYPLNEVKGINEYLNACYPYVKEAATDEDGNIWMLPIGVDIPGWLVNKNNLEQEDLGLKNNMTYEEFYWVVNSMTGEQKNRSSYNAMVVYMNFISQNYRQSADLNRPDFARTIKLFQQYDSTMPQTINVFDINVLQDKVLFAYIRQSADYENYLQQFKKTKELAVYSMPKQQAGDPNTGSCTFLAVNAGTRYPKEVLSYLEELIAYISSRETSPLYFKGQEKETNGLRSSLEQLYENGEIVFNIDREVYSEGLFKTIEQGGSLTDYIYETQRKLEVYFKE